MQMRSFRVQLLIGRKKGGKVLLGLLAVVLAAGLSAVTPGGQGRAQAGNAGLSPQVVAQLQGLVAEKRSRSPEQQKIDSQLLYAARMARGQAIAAGVAALDTGIVPETDGRVIVDVRATITDGLINELRNLGADVIASHPAYDDIRIQVGFDRLEAIAALPAVRNIMPRGQAITNSRRDLLPATPEQIESARVQRRLARETMVARLREVMASRTAQGPIGNVGARKSQGDQTHEAAESRGTWGLTGAGIKIGVLSDGVGGLATSQASGDLPAVTVLPGQAGSGAEGTAMLEIIHDLAPGAQLFFATAFSGITSFAQNIRDLRTVHGCDIIVDDVFYFVETPMQDGQTYVSPTNGAVVMQAVKDVAAAGALFFSSAGNSGNKNDGTSGTWQGNFISGGAVAFPEVGEIHQFTAGQNFNVLNATGFLNTLHWSDPLAGSGNDYDLFRLSADGLTILAGSTNPQDGNDDPYEQMSAGSSGHRIVVIKFDNAGLPASLPRFLHLDTVRGRLSVSTEGNIKGHSAVSAANAFGVAATPAQFPGPFPNPFTGTNVVETFSSDGPRRTFFTEAGAAITPGDFLSTGGMVLNKPDITAADGVSVTGNGGFPTTFFGTSAAAPHAAAIAALIKSRPGPALTATQISAALTGTAIDIEGAGVDRDSGVGIVMADAAIASVIPPFGGPFGQIITNGDFSTVISHQQTPNTHQPAGWLLFATPDLSHIVSQVVNGVFEYFRVPNGQNQAVIFQETGVAYPANWPLTAQFNIGNSDNVRKRISVLIIDSDFSDITVCTFWLPPNSPLAPYTMHTHTSKAWSNAAIYFYAATAGSNGGFYRLDDVALFTGVASTTKTTCHDPLGPGTPGGAPGPELLVNGDFASGVLAPWIAFGNITQQINMTPHPSVGGASVFEFLRSTTAPPAGVVLQSTGQAMTAGQIMTATFQLGNSSRVVKRVTALLHDSDFSDLHACTFYLFPGQPLSNYVMKTYASKAWTNATFSLYPATIGPEPWIRLDNVSFKRTPGTVTLGTECEEPLLTTLVQSATTASTAVRPRVARPLTRDGFTADGFSRSDAGSGWASIARTARSSVLALDAPLDLTNTGRARMTFKSSLRAVDSEAEVQVSVDGRTWITIGTVPRTELMEPVDVDLSGFSGRVIWLRFVFDGGPAMDGVRPDVWRIDEIQIHRDSSAPAAMPRPKPRGSP